ncbi:MAG: hypothetical protein L0332_11825 [Chloroflexi bacterium]|nr:hypothetical protein [Chloroflexota bacterium]MCI0576683.1 hypothetical protein [Chloroflexota bacterium]MCI0647996.1 hypothetical protein [Chloroflexota bacterium]MCI0727397.1 hypothetical protein [Chloroflexota bacterium]
MLRIRIQNRHLVAVLLLGLLVRLPWLAGDLNLTADLPIFREWVRLIQAHGLAEFYGRTPHTAYGPVSAYLYGAAGWVEAGLPAGLRGEAALNVLIKLPPALADVLLAGVMAWLLRGRPPWLRLLACAAYLFSPGPWYVSALWGQLDGVYTFFLVAAVAALAKGRVTLSWLAWTLAMATKLQSFVLLPLLVTVTAGRYGLRRLMQGLAAGGALGLLLAAPWLLNGRLVELLRANVPGQLPVVVTAYNLWYLLLAGDPTQAAAGDQVGGLPISYATFSAGLYGAFVFLVCGRVARRRGAVSLATATALLALGMFLLLSGVRERYLLPVLPFLLLAAAGWERPAAGGRRYGWAYVALSLTFFFNLATVASFAPALWTNLVVWQPPYPTLIAILKVFSFLAAAIHVVVLAWLMARWMGEQTEPGQETPVAAQPPAMR